MCNYVLHKSGQGKKMTGLHRINDQTYYYLDLREYHHFAWFHHTIQRINTFDDSSTRDKTRHSEWQQTKMNTNLATGQAKENDR
jgi:hypothetical protein